MVGVEDCAGGFVFAGAEAPVRVILLEPPPPLPPFELFPLTVESEAPPVSLLPEEGAAVPVLIAPVGVTTTGVDTEAL